MGEGEQYNVTNGGFGSEGKFNFEVPMDKPCYISLINNRRNNIDYSLAGSNITAFKMILTYPYNLTNYTMVPLGQTMRLSKSEDITLIYLGSIYNQNTTSMFQWKNIPDPVVKSALHLISFSFTIAILSLVVIIA